MPDEFYSNQIKVGQRGVVTLPQGLRQKYGIEPGTVLTLLDLGGVFVLSPSRSEIDDIADRIASALASEGETLESMLHVLREERARYEPRSS